MLANTEGGVYNSILKSQRFYMSWIMRMTNKPSREDMRGQPYRQREQLAQGTNS